MNRQYIGARYVPKLDGAWDSRKSYEGLVIVEYNGNSYTSKRNVPVGIDILNVDYWICTGNYNAQVELYRRETAVVDSRVKFTSPEEYGAKGDGVTDDTEAIQDALDSGKLVVFGNKKYGISSAIRLNTKTNYDFSGCTLVAISDMDSMIISNITGVPYFIKNVILDCNENANYGITVESGTADITNAIIVNANLFGVNFVSGYHNWMHDVKIYNTVTHSGGVKNACEDTKLVGCEIYYCSPAIETTKMMQIDSTHMWEGGTGNDSSIGVDIKAFTTLIFVNSYFDSYNTAVNCNIATKLIMSGCFIYYSPTSSYNEPISIRVGGYSQIDLNGVKIQKSDSVTALITPVWYSDNCDIINNDMKNFNKFDLMTFNKFSPYYYLGANKGKSGIRRNTSIPAGKYVRIGHIGVNHSGNSMVTLECNNNSESFYVLGTFNLQANYTSSKAYVKYESNYLEVCAGAKESVTVRGTTYYYHPLYLHNITEQTISTYVEDVESITDKTMLSSGVVVYNEMEVVENPTIVATL